LAYGNLKNWTAALFLLLAGCSLQKEPVQYVRTCQSTAALKAFETTAYEPLTRSCTTCHATLRSPLLASATLRRAYQQALTVVSFERPERSRIVQKMNDGHCGPACEARGSEMISAIESWKAAHSAATDSECGSGTPPAPAETAKEQVINERTIFSVAVPLPANLPLGPDAYVDIAVPLPNGLEGLLYLQVQRYTVRDGIDGGSYRFRMPRLYIASGNSPLYLKDLGLSINYGTKSVFVTYHSLDTSVGPSGSPGTSPLLSPLITDPIPQEKESGDALVLSFGVLRTTEAVNCKNVTGFRDLVYNPASGIALTRNCQSCHTAGHVRAANYTMAAGETLADVCRRVLPRITRLTPEQSPLIRNPATGANGHPYTVTGDFSKFVEWIESERD
jgi:hypothetical protein